jgi:glycosyltransferase involved in cell wall biosynthesis
MLTCQFVEIMGGAEKQCRTLSSELVALGEDVVVLSSRVPGVAIDDDRLGVKVVRFWCPSPPQLAGRFILSSLIWAAQAFAWIVWHHREIKVVHAHQLRINAYVAAFATWALGVPSVLKLGVGGPENDLVVIGRRKYLWGQAGVRFVIRNATRFVAISKQIELDLRSYGVPPSAIVCIPNGVDLGKYAARLESTQAERASSLKSAPVFSFVGRLSTEKNVVSMIDGLRSVPAPLGARVLLAGDGPLRGALEDMVREHENSPNIALLGSVNEVDTILRRSHFLLLLSASEGLSNALLEALAAGVVPILTDMSGARDVIPFVEYPLFAATGDKQQIAEAVSRAYEIEPAVWLDWSRRLAQHAEVSFNLRGVAARYVELYRGLKDPEKDGSVRRSVEAEGAR